MEGGHQRQIVKNKIRQITLRSRQQVALFLKKYIYIFEIFMHKHISADGGTDRLCSVTISGLRGSRNILGSERIPPDGKPTMTKRSPLKMKTRHLAAWGRLSHQCVEQGEKSNESHNQTYWADGGLWCPSPSAWPPLWKWRRGRCRTAAAPEGHVVDPAS